MIFRYSRGDLESWLFLKPGILGPPQNSPFTPLAFPLSKILKLEIGVRGRGFPLQDGVRREDEEKDYCDDDARDGDYIEVV